MNSLGKVALVPPPSANQITRWFKNRPYRTKKADEWLEYASAQIRRNILPTTGMVEVHIRIREGKGILATSDADNYQKLTMDALKPEKRHKETGQLTKPGAGVIADDCIRYVRRIVTEVLPEIKESKTRRGEAEIIVEVFAL